MAYNIIPIIQIKFQLVSDFIPASIFYEVANPFICISVVLFMAVIAAFILFFRKKYLTVIILGVAAFFPNQIYIHLIQ
ncbi:hypothetical protein [Pedobacter rhodius]|uniref:Uncharacterized protein n=1 Tax=Pedobacter rhodius TaxID=3004098 RepID=A0ABT4KZW8_9SPHI|nr:hypothetical protein [Pedobacter sp. SJ11]MCZ4224478.1 hypothetical protein [Pedobacter sp. SJ11]